jgi:hypothetical protein
MAPYRQTRGGAQAPALASPSCRGADVDMADLARRGASPLALHVTVLQSGASVAGLR